MFFIVLHQRQHYIIIFTIIKIFFQCFTSSFEKLSGPILLYISLDVYFFELSYNFSSISSRSMNNFLLFQLIFTNSRFPLCFTPIIIIFDFLSIYFTIYLFYIILLIIFFIHTLLYNIFYTIYTTIKVTIVNFTISFHNK